MRKSPVYGTNFQGLKFRLLSVVSPLEPLLWRTGRLVCNFLSPPWIFLFSPTLFLFSPASDRVFQSSNTMRGLDNAVRAVFINKRRLGGILISLLLAVTIFSSFHNFAPEYHDVAVLAEKFSKKVATPYDNALAYIQSHNEVSGDLEIFVGNNNRERLLDFDREHLKVLYPEVINELYARTDLDRVDWSKYAYVLYATSPAHVCNNLMKFAELRKWGSRASFVMLVNKDFLDEEKSPDVYKQLMEFSEKYTVHYKPTQLVRFDGDHQDTWVNSFTKLLVFNETDYQRVIYMDSDAILTHSHLDELFFIPPCKMAVSNAYWLAREKIQENQNKYNPREWGFRPMTTLQRQQKIDKLVSNIVTPYVDPITEKLHIRFSNATREEKINEKNFYTNVYNSLPNNPALDEFTLTNIIMVIQPTDELFARVTDAFKNRAPKEFDMDLVEKRIFPTKPSLKRQISNSPGFKEGVTFDERLEEIPEMLVLPHRAYATLTLELDTESWHTHWAADTHDEPFALYKDLDRDNFRYYFDVDQDMATGDFIYQETKYIHFSDYPIPKPWWKKDINNGYMGHRMRCPSHPDFAETDGRVKPGRTTADCTAGLNWEKVHLMFAQLRKDVCGLDLMVPDADKNTYFDIIN